MRIAQIAPLVERVPPRAYGGTERVVSVLTEELVRRGHDVTLYASGDSVTAADVSATVPRALREDRSDNIYSVNPPVLHLLGRAYAHARDYDIIHDHTGTMGLSFAELSPTPVVLTQHGNLDADELPLYREFRRAVIVPISRALAERHPGLNYTDVIHHGLPFDRYPFGKHPGRYLLYVGRICREKGTHLAVRLARELGLPLIIAAKLEHAPQEMRYFRTHVRPYLSSRIDWVGEVDERERNRLMAGALCLVHPITWDEPFGLTLIESMACGTPVVAMGRGSIPEIVRHGVTGYVADSYEQMKAAISQVHRIDRAACRDYARSQFSVGRMADAYESLYRSLVKAPLPAIQTPPLTRLPSPGMLWGYP